MEEIEYLRNSFDELGNIYLKEASVKVDPVLINGEVVTGSYLKMRFQIK